MSIEIIPYEFWMKQEVSKMFNKQYGVSEQTFSSLMDDFYDHPYQKDKCIRIAAIEKKVIIGFQSFFHWPYTLNNKIFNSFQSGNSLVHPEHRGKGIFQKLLNYFDSELQKKLDVDFLIGFPVEESKNSFIRNNWKNILNLNWYIKLCNPARILFSVNEKKINNKFSLEHVFINESARTLRLIKSPEFIHWRKSYSSTTKYFNYEYFENSNKMCFQLKLNKRKHFIKELVIGDMQCNNYDEKFIYQGIHQLNKIAFSAGITFMSVALNKASSDGFAKIFNKVGFKETNRNINFIIKNFISLSELTNHECWTLYRSDIDTW